MILRIIGIFLFIWFDGLPGGTRPTGLRQQPVLRLFCCFGGICRPPVSIFEAFRPKRYYFMHNYPFFDILSLQAPKKTAARSFYSLANDSNFDRNPVRGCNYGLEGGCSLMHNIKELQISLFSVSNAIIFPFWCPTLCWNRRTLSAQFRLQHLSASFSYSGWYAQGLPRSP